MTLRFVFHNIHLFPHESVQAALDAGVQKVMPFHWAAFNLSYHHSWSEPAEIFAEAAQEKALPYILPALGQVFEIASEDRRKWWQ